MNEQTTQATSAQELVNVPEVVKAFGRSYEIKKFALGPFTRALEYVGPIGYVLGWINDLPKGVDEDGKTKIVATQKDMMELATRAASISGSSIFGLISIATQEPIEWLEEQDAMEGLKIFAKVIEKNLPLFSQENMDQIASMIGNFQQQTQKQSGA